MTNVHQHLNPEHPAAVRGWCVAAAEVEAERVQRAALAEYGSILDHAVAVCEQYVAEDPAVEPLAAAVLEALAGLAAHEYRATVAESQHRLRTALASLAPVGGDQ